MRLSVVIPVYNERPTIEECLKRVQAVAIDKEILIIDDASTDGTREVLAALPPDEPQLSTKGLHDEQAVERVSMMKRHFPYYRQTLSPRPKEHLQPAGSFRSTACSANYPRALLSTLASSSTTIPQLISPLLQYLFPTRRSKRLGHLNAKHGRAGGAEPRGIVGARSEPSRVRREQNPPRLTTRLPE